MNPPLRKGVFYLFALLLLFSYGCKGFLSGSKGKSVIITGRVIDKKTAQPIRNAVVRIVRPLPQIDEVTDSTGAFTFNIKVDSTVTFTIEAIKVGYNVYTTSVLGVPGRDVALPEISLQVDTTTSSGGSGSTSGYAATIKLSSVSSQSIQVEASGGNESSMLTFQVQDSSGIPVDLNHSATVNFHFGAAPGGGENLYPIKAVTNADGQVSTTLTSGTKAGIVQVIAQATVKGTTLYSKPVPVTINGGLPDQAHFTLAPKQYNIPFPLAGAKYNFTAYAGDQYGNVVAPGVVVYFTTNGGYIEGSAPTGADGAAPVNLIDGNPFPPNGIASITATTADQNGNPVTATSQVIFSKSPIITITPTTINVPNGGSQTFNYSVKDINGYPMAPGTSINVAVTGKNISTTGKLSVTLLDVNPDLGNLSQMTNYSFIINDSQPTTTASVPVTVTISVKGPNGNANMEISGTSN